MSNLKFGWNQYWAPTPKNIRKIADSLLAGALTVSTISFANDYKTVAIIVLTVAGLAKFASNLFSDDTPAEKVD